MSSMLEQAIIDAEALKEAALKNAEDMIIEKYSHEIKSAVDSLLEQPEEEEELNSLLGEPDASPTPDLEEEDAATGLPLAHTEGGDDLCPCPESEVSIDLQQIAEELGEEITADELIDREKELAPSIEEEINDTLELDELDEDFLADLLEKLTLDVKNVPTGQAGGASNETLDKENEDIALATEDVEELEQDEEKEELKESVKKLQEENKSLLEKKEEYKNMLVNLKDKLEEVNLSNAKLLYTNRVLGSASLNERQRRKIVEALSKADSVEEAKVIYETLQSAVGRSERKRTPKSLSEVVTRNSSTTMSRSKEAKVDDPTSYRWKVLAGIQAK